MRIVHIAHVPLPRDHPCGSKALGTAYHPGRWVLNLAIAQKAHTEDTPEVVVKNPGATRNWSTEIEGIKVHFVATPNILRGKTGFFLDQRLLARAAMKLKPDIVHAHGTEEANALAALRCPVPRVLTIQGCFFIINRKLPAKLFSRQWIVESLERRTIPQFRHVIAKSKYILGEIKKEFPCVRPMLIPNTYDASLVSISPCQPRAQVAAYVGSIAPWKGVHILADALESNAHHFNEDFQLHIFGDKPDINDGYEGDVKRRLRIALGNRLHLHGVIPQMEVLETVARCKALLAPSIEDMFGNQAIEAMLVGTPVLTIEGTAIAENVKRFGNGIVSTPETFGRDLGALITKQHDAAKSERAREAIMQEMSPIQVAKAHIQIYKEIIGIN